jgi:hypothetical protein
MGDNTITGSSTGLAPIEGGTLLSWGNNLLAGNGTDGVPTGTITPVRAGG